MGPREAGEGQGDASGVARHASQIIGLLIITSMILSSCDLSDVNCLYNVYIAVNTGTSCSWRSEII